MYVPKKCWYILRKKANKTANVNTLEYQLPFGNTDPADQDKLVLS